MHDLRAYIERTSPKENQSKGAFELAVDYGDNVLWAADYMGPFLAEKKEMYT